MDQILRIAGDDLRSCREPVEARRCIDRDNPQQAVPPSDLKRRASLKNTVQQSIDVGAQLGGCDRHVRTLSSLCVRAMPEERLATMCHKPRMRGLFMAERSQEAHTSSAHPVERPPVGVPLQEHDEPPALTRGFGGIADDHRCSRNPQSRLS